MQIEDHFPTEIDQMNASESPSETRHPLNAVEQLRIIGWLEGASFVILMFIAMPLKYLADMPLMVKWTGWAHGVLFIIYFWYVFKAARAMKWSFRRVAEAGIASLLPFGPFIHDHKLREDSMELEARDS